MQRIYINNTLIIFIRNNSQNERNRNRSNAEELIDLLQLRCTRSPSIEQRPSLVVAHGTGTKSFFYHGVESSSPQHRPAAEHGRRDLSVPGGLQKLADAETKDELNRYR